MEEVLFPDPLADGSGSGNLANMEGEGTNYCWLLRSEDWQKWEKHGLLNIIFVDIIINSHKFECLISELSILGAKTFSNLFASLHRKVTNQHHHRWPIQNDHKVPKPNIGDSGRIMKKEKTLVSCALWFYFSTISFPSRWWRRRKHMDGDEVDNNCKDDVISNSGATSLENGNIQSQVVEENVGWEGKKEFWSRVWSKNWGKPWRSHWRTSSTLGSVSSNWQLDLAGHIPHICYLCSTRSSVHNLFYTWMCEVPSQISCKNLL